MQPKLSKALLVLVPLLLFAALLPLITSTEHSIWPDETTEADLCTSYLKEGTIYSGQPYCGQGVMMYIFLALTRIPTLGKYSQTAYTVFFLALHVIALLSIFAIIRKETGKSNYLLPTILYIGTVFLFVRGISSLLVMFFIILGFYVFRYTNFRWHKIVGALIMTCGALSKGTALPVFGLATAYLFFNEFKPLIKEKKFAAKELFKTGSPFIAILAFIALMFLIWPNMFWYAFGSATFATKLGFFEIINEFSKSLTVNSGTMFFGLLLLASLFSWLKLRDFYSGISVISILVLFGLFFRLSGFSDAGFVFSTSRIDYYSAVYPFFIIAMAKLRNQQKVDKISKISKFDWVYPCVFILLVFLLSTSAEFIVAERDVEFMDRSFQELLGLIPPTGLPDHVLVEDDLEGNAILAKYYKENFTLDVIPHPEYWNEGNFPDGFVWRYLEHYGLSKREQWVTKMPNRTLDYSAKIANDTYSIILLGPPQWYQVDNALRAANVTGKFCVAKLPDLRYRTPEGKHLLQVIFFIRNRCAVYLHAIEERFKSKLDEVLCEKSPYVHGQIAAKELEKHGMNLEKCTENKDSLLYYTRRTYHIRMKTLLFAIIITLIAWGGSVPRVRFSKPGGRQGTSKSAESSSPSSPHHSSKQQEAP